MPPLPHPTPPPPRPVPPLGSAPNSSALQGSSLSPPPLSASPPSESSLKTHAFFYLGSLSGTTLLNQAHQPRPELPPQHGWRPDRVPLRAAEHGDPGSLDPRQDRARNLTGGDRAAASAQHRSPQQLAFKAGMRWGCPSEVHPGPHLGAAHETDFHGDPGPTRHAHAEGEHVAHGGRHLGRASAF